MGGMKTYILSALLLIAPLTGPAPAFNLNELTLTFAGCAGRLSAQMEHEWLLSDPDAERTEAHRGAMVGLLQATMPADAGREILAHRIQVKAAHSRLLTRASFNNDPDDARWARLRAETEIATCLSMMLN